MQLKPLSGKETMEQLGTEVNGSNRVEGGAGSREMALVGNKVVGKREISKVDGKREMVSGVGIIWAATWKWAA